MDDLTDQLRTRCCDLGTDDHGHTDCWLYGLAITEIDQLRTILRVLTYRDGDGNIRTGLAGVRLEALVDESAFRLIDHLHPPLEDTDG